MADQQVVERRVVEEALESVFFVERALFVVERITIALFGLVYVHPTFFFLFLSLSTLFNIMTFKERGVIVSQTTLQRSDYADRSFENSYVFWFERAIILISAFHQLNPYIIYVVVGLFAISNTIYILKKLGYSSLLPLLENLKNEEVGNGSRVMKEVEGDYNNHEVEKAELYSFEKFLLWFQGLAFFLLLSSFPFVSILRYPLLLSDILLTLCYGVRRVLPYPLPNYYSYMFWLERLKAVILLIYNHYGITSYKSLPISLFVLSISLHIIINYMPCIFEQKMEKISGHNSSGTPSTRQPKESGKERSETDHAKDQADDDGVIIKNVHESDQSDDGVAVGEIVENVAEIIETSNENGNTEIGDHLKREIDYQVVAFHEEEEEEEDDDDDSEDGDGDDDDSDDDSEDGNDDDSEDGDYDDSEDGDDDDDDDDSEDDDDSDDEEEDEEDVENYRRKMMATAVEILKYRLEQRKDPAEQDYEKFIKYIIEWEENKKGLNKKLNLSKAASEEQSQKWEEERKELVSKLNNATSLLEHHKDTVDAFNEDRCKWEEEKAKLKSDMQELTSQNEENALSLMNLYEDHCRESKAEMDLLRAKLRAAKESTKYYRGIMHESENMRLKLVEDNKELAAKLQDSSDHYSTLKLVEDTKEIAAKLQEGTEEADFSCTLKLVESNKKLAAKLQAATLESDHCTLKLVEDNKELAAKLQEATVEADHYYTLLHEFDERCRSWQEAYYYIYYNYYHGITSPSPPTNVV